MPEAWNIRYWVHLVTHKAGKHKTRHCGHLTRHKDEEHEKLWASDYHLTRKHEILEASNCTRIIGENQMYWSNQIMPEVWKQEILGHSIMPEDKEAMLFGASDKSLKGKTWKIKCTWLHQNKNTWDIGSIWLQPKWENNILGTSDYAWSTKTWDMCIELNLKQENTRYLNHPGTPKAQKMRYFGHWIMSEMQTHKTLGASECIWSGKTWDIGSVWFKTYTFDAL